MHSFANLKQVEAALEPFLPSKLKRFAYTPEHVEHFMAHIGNPQDAPFAIHVAGTSGKTSTAYYTAALLKQAGKKVGLLISPHVEAINERVQIDLSPLPVKRFCDEMAIFLDLVEQSGIVLTHAEILYSFAYWEFVRQDVDCIVVEVGMGGLLDATNVINRPDKICIITDIGFDHTNVLGNSLREITGHKAGIIRLHSTVFCHRQQAQIMDEITDVCRQKQAELHIIDAMRPFMDLHFLPLFQQRNFTLALEAVTFVMKKEKREFTKEQILAAARIYIPSRMEVIEHGKKLIVLDGAHNPQKLRALRESLEDYFPNKSVAVLAGFSGRGRSTEESLIELAPIGDYLILTSVQTGALHSHPPEPDEIVAECKRLDIEAVAIADQAQAYQALLERPESILLITGSIYLLGQLRPLISGSAVHP